MARKLRIAVSVFFGLATVALCVLWVRSYISWDVLSCERTYTLSFIGSVSGCAYFTHQNEFGGIPPLGWRLESVEVPEWERPPIFVREPNKLSVTVPYLLLVAISVAPIGLTLLSPSKRFSLRTLLIATTLVAAVLGLGVWLTR